MMAKGSSPTHLEQEGIQLVAILTTHHQMPLNPTHNI